MLDHVCPTALSPKLGESKRMVTRLSRRTYGHAPGVEREGEVARVQLLALPCEQGPGSQRARRLK